MPKHSAAEKRERATVPAPTDTPPTPPFTDPSGLRDSSIALEIKLLTHCKPAQDIITAERAAKALRLSVNAEAEVYMVLPDGTRVAIPIPDRKADHMTCDELLSDILKMQEERHPDTDPGDILIDCQDDGPMMVFQGTKQQMIGAGDTIQAALMSAHAHVKISSD
jgi:hypothetical protein